MDMSKKRRLVKSIFLTLAVLVASLVFLSVGYYLGAKKVSIGGSYNLVNRDQDQLEELDFSVFWQVWDEVHKRYVNPSEIDDRELVRGAIEGMVGALDDPYSAFMPPNQSEIFSQDLEGSFGGVGIMIELVDGNLTVTSPLDGSPAEKAGIISEDIIVKIDGRLVEEMNFEEMVSSIRGKIGTEVELIIFRPKENEQLEFNITREEIVVESVEYEMIEENIGYLRINQFGNDTLGLINEASEFFSDEGANKLVVDLRSNPGGFFDVAVQVSSKFIEDGVIVYQQNQDQTEAFEAVGRATMTDYSLVVLVNEGSASAAEIMAGALRDQKGAKLVGSKTFGKGSVQDLKNIGRWGSLRITSGRWLTPEKELINSKGLKPDIKIEMEASKVGADDDKQLERALKILSK